MREAGPRKFVTGAKTSFAIQIFRKLALSSAVCMYTLSLRTDSELKQTFESLPLNKLSTSEIVSEQETMKTRSSDVQLAANRGGKRKAPAGDEHGRGKRRSVKSDEPKSSPQIDRRLAPKRTILSGIHGCVSPRCSASTHRSSFSWYRSSSSSSPIARRFD